MLAETDEFVVIANEEVAISATFDDLWTREPSNRRVQAWALPAPRGQQAA